MRTQVGLGGPVRSYTRPLSAKSPAPEVAKRLTRIGIGGPVRNYTTPLGDKAESETPEGNERFRGPFLVNVGRLM